MGTAAAITGAITGGSAILGAFSSRSSSKRAASAAKSGSDAQAQTAQASLAQTAQLAGQSRDSANKLFGQREKNVRAGIASGEDLYRQTMPHQFSQMNAGNQNAQQVLSGGLQQANNAILGGAIDYSAFQPQSTPDIDMSMFETSTPNYTFTDGTDNFTPEPEPVSTRRGSLLGGYGGRGVRLSGGNQGMRKLDGGRARDFLSGYNYR